MTIIFVLDVIVFNHITPFKKDDKPDAVIQGSVSGVDHNSETCADVGQRWISHSYWLWFAWHILTIR